MKVYLDTNILIRLYLNLDGSNQARDLLFANDIKASWPLPVTDLLACEFTNGLQRLVFEKKQNEQWRINAKTAMACQAFLNDHLEQRNFLSPNPLALSDIKPKFEELCLRHTAKHGFRTYDMLHVSSALTLQCSHFFSFDKKALKLAHLEGLKTN